MYTPAHPPLSCRAVSCRSRFFSSISLALVFVIVLNLFVAAPPAGAKDKDPELPKPEERCELERIADVDRQETPLVPILAFFGSSFGQAIGKALLNLSSSALNRYAEQYEASYSARLVGNDFEQTYNGSVYADLVPKFQGEMESEDKPTEEQKAEGMISARLDQTHSYRFRRILIYRGPELFTKEMIAKSLGLDPKALPDSCMNTAGTEGTVKLTKFIAFEFVFNVVVGGSKAEAMRVVPVSISYHAPAAKKLKVPFTKKDELQAAISVALKESHLPDAKNFNRTLQFSSSIAKLEAIKSSLGPKYSSDWMPSIAGRCYSIEVKVIESSDAKKWIEKAAKELGEWGQGKLDDLKS